MLGIARAVGETAPLLFTAFGLDYMNANPFSGPQEACRSSSSATSRSRRSAAIDRALTASLVLMIVIVVALFAIARFVGRRPRPRLAGPAGSVARPAAPDRTLETS